MENDLRDLEAQIGKVSKEELGGLKKKWLLQTKIAGTDVDRNAARKVLHKELSNKVEDLRSRVGHMGQGAAVGPANLIRNAALNTSGAAISSGSSASGAVTGRSPARLGAAALATAGALGLAWLVISRQAKQAPPAPAGDKAVPAGGSAAAAAVAAAAAGGAELEPTTSKQTVGTAKPPAAADATAAKVQPAAAANDAAKPIPEAEPAAESAASEVWSPSQVSAAVALGAVGAVLAFAGLWWLTIGRRPPTLPPAATVAAAAVAANTEEVNATQAARLASLGLNLEAAAPLVQARKAAEVVFENAPSEGQTWDMAASIRGIPGGVQSRVGKFESGALPP